MLTDYFIAWHLDQMRSSGTSIRERIVYFLHSHLPARRSIIESSEALYYQNCFFRYYAFRNFNDLFKKICIDNAMLVYIDGRLNINLGQTKILPGRCLNSIQLEKVRKSEREIILIIPRDIRKQKGPSGYKNDITSEMLMQISASL